MQCKEKYNLSPGHGRDSISSIASDPDQVPYYQLPEVQERLSLYWSAWSTGIEKDTESLRLCLKKLRTSISIGWERYY